MKDSREPLLMTLSSRPGHEDWGKGTAVTRKQPPRHPDPGPADTLTSDSSPRPQASTCRGLPATQASAVRDGQGRGLWPWHSAVPLL